MASLKQFQQNPIVKIYSNGLNWMMKFTHKDVWWGPFDSRAEAVALANKRGYDIQKS